VNNVLAFPGIFKGALEVRATRITSRMKLAAAYTIADAVGEISRDYIIPSSLDFKIADKVSEAVKGAWLEEVEINRLMEVVNHPL
jgi:malate dehydrogenase (oxaloacetate-decarboxylating)